MEARKHTVYSYNEGEATEGGPYHLVTTIVGALRRSRQKKNPAPCVPRRCPIVARERGLEAAQTDIGHDRTQPPKTRSCDGL